MDIRRDRKLLDQAFSEGIRTVGELALWIRRRGELLRGGLMGSVQA